MAKELAGKVAIVTGGSSGSDSPRPSGSSTKARTSSSPTSIPSAARRGGGTRRDATFKLTDVAEPDEVHELVDSQSSASVAYT